MEKGFDSWFQNQQINYLSPNLNLPSAQFPSFGNMVSSPVRQEPCGWFFGLPRYRQGLVPVVNSIVQKAKGQLPVPNADVTREVNGTQKKFLVFDQSGDQTTLIYNSGRYQFPSLNNLKPQFGSDPVHVDEFIKENDSRTESREDTEELNALLYSDDDDVNDHDDENEETSTGHSPNLMTGKHENEEVASSWGTTKKRKREDEGKIVNLLQDTGSSGNSGINCNDGNEAFEGQFGNFSCGDTRMRKEKMKETINLLRNIIPSDKNGKNAIVVIDEAISYLRGLKVKAKALGI